jgi:Glycosyltransferase
MRKKKVAMVAPDIAPLYYGGQQGGAGGAERQLALIAKGLSNRGHEIVFFARPLDCAGSQITNSNWKIVLNRFRFFGGSKLFLLLDGVRLIFQLRRQRPEYIMMRAGGALLMAPLLAYRLIYGGRLVNFIQIDREVGDVNVYYKGHKRLLARLYQKFLRKADLIFCQTHFQQNLIVKQIKRHAVRIDNIAGALWDRSDRSQLQTFDIFWAGSTAAQKRFELVLQLAQLLPEMQFKVAMNGARSKPDLQAYPNIEFLGQVSPVEIEQYFNRCRVFLNTSAQEGFPNTFLQAWYYGKPVATAGIDPDGVVSREKTGIVVPVNEENDLVLLAGQIRQLLSDKNTYQYLSNNALRYVQKNRSIDEVTAVIDHAINELP